MTQQMSLGLWDPCKHFLQISQPNTSRSTIVFLIKNSLPGENKTSLYDFFFLNLLIKKPYKTNNVIFL